MSYIAYVYDRGTSRLLFSVPIQARTKNDAQQRAKHYRNASRRVELDKLSE